MTEHTTRRNPEMERYVTIRPVVTEDGEQFALYLKVGNQEFRVGQYPDETLERAEWMRDMLCIALANILADAAPVGGESMTKVLIFGY